MLFNRARTEIDHAENDDDQNDDFNYLQHVENLSFDYVNLISFQIPFGKPGIPKYLKKMEIPKMDRKKFFDTVKSPLFGGSFSNDQVKGLDAILNKMEKLDGRWLAYALATAHHETGGKMVPVLENLNYSAEGLRRTFPKYFSVADAAKYARKPEAIANRAYGNRMGNGPEASGDGWKYRGRGLVQITGKDNYTKYGIADNPEKALDPDVAVAIMFDGMTAGKFTGKKLSDYFNASNTDWTGARAIINGTDRADDIKKLAQKFYVAIQAAK